MVHQAKHLALGRAGEEKAVGYLKSLGWRICARNWRPTGASQGFELDIVAIGKREIIFVEVKTRSVNTANERSALAAFVKGLDCSGIPSYAAFSPHKRSKFLRAAKYYLTAHDLWHKPCRFDLILVARGQGGDMELEHCKDVIESGDLMDSGHASWQPW